MATAGTVRTVLGRRLRDTAFTAHPQTLVLRLIDTVQKALNAGLGIRRSTTTFTASARRLFYQNTDVASDIARIDSMRHEGSSLIEIDWHTLMHGDPNWYRRVGPKPTCWARVGGDLFVVWPAPNYGIDLEVSYTRVSPLIDADADVMDFPDEYLPLVEDFCEALLSMKSGKFAQMEDPMKRFTDAITAIKGMKIDRTEKAGG